MASICEKIPQAQYQKYLRLKLSKTLCSMRRLIVRFFLVGRSFVVIFVLGKKQRARCSPTKLRQNLCLKSLWDFSRLCIHDHFLVFFYFQWKWYMWHFPTIKIWREKIVKIGNSHVHLNRYYLLKTRVRNLWSQDHWKNPYIVTKWLF